MQLLKIKLFFTTLYFIHSTNIQFITGDKYLGFFLHVFIFFESGYILQLNWLQVGF